MVMEYDPYSAHLVNIFHGSYVLSRPAIASFKSVDFIFTQEHVLLYAQIARTTSIAERYTQFCEWIRFAPGSDG